MVGISHTFTFADLFAGIGGMRLAFEKAGGKCVLSSEIDHRARKTYENHWKTPDPGHVSVHDVVYLGDVLAGKNTPVDDERYEGNHDDASRLGEVDIPDFDVMVAGFPCQPYSIAGLRQGLDDEKGRGHVFLSMLDILKSRRPRAFLLENVKGMLSHNKGKTIEWMIEQLEICGYDVLEPTVLNSMVHGGVPQNRERVFIIGFDVAMNFHKVEFNWPEEMQLKKSLQGLLLHSSQIDEKYVYTREKYDCYDEIATVAIREDTAYQWRRVYVRENKSGVCPALTANMGSGGHNVPLVRVGPNIRKLTPRECARLQGFPDSFKFPNGMADMHLYHQFGNSVTVPLIEKLAKELAKHLR